VIGTSRDYTLRVPANDGSTYTLANTPFSGQEGLSSTLSLGVDQPVLLTIPTSWQAATDTIPAGWETGTYVASFQDSKTWGLVPGEYVLQATAARNGRTVGLGVFYLPIAQVSGSATALPVYGSLDDMRIYCAWIDRLEHPSKRAQFVRERNRARRWLDNLIQRHFRASGYGISTIGYPIGGIGPYRTGGKNVWLEGLLKQDLLQLNDDLREVLAKKALGYALEYQIGSHEGTSYQSLATMFHVEADNLVLMANCAININRGKPNDDGWPTLIFELGTADSLWA
jgi:hypothetical protein